jgi:hypothetical protein
VLSLQATSNVGGSSVGGMLGGVAATFIGAPGAVAAGAAIIAVAGLAVVLHGAWNFNTRQPGATPHR